MAQKFREPNNHGFDIGYLSVDGTDIWCIVSAGHWQGIFRIDLKTDIIHYVDEIPTEKYILEYQVVIRVNDKIILAPFFSEKGFLEYDLNKKKFVQKDIGRDIPRKFDTDVAFSNVVKYKNSIIFLANQSKKIIEYCVDTGRYVMRKDLENILPHELTNGEYKVDLHCCRLLNNILFYVVCESNILVELNLDTFDGRYYEIPYVKKAESLHICGNKLYIVPLYNDPFVCVDMNTWEAKKLLNLSQNENVLAWYGMFNLRNKSILIPYRFPMVYSISNSINEWQKESDLFREWFGEKTEGVLCNCITHPESDGRCFFYVKCNNYLVEVTADRNVVIHKPKMLSSDWDVVRERIWNASNTFNEYELLSVHDFLYLINQDESTKSNDKDIKSYGAMIYKSLY